MLHRRDDCAQRVHLQAFFQNESGAQVERACATHGEIVDRAIDCEIADVAAGKNQRAHNERIGRKRQARAVDRQHRAIVPLLERVVREGGHENLFDELMGQASAAAVREDDAVVSDSRDWDSSG